MAPGCKKKDKKEWHDLHSFTHRGRCDRTGAISRPQNLRWSSVSAAGMRYLCVPYVFTLCMYLIHVGTASAERHSGMYVSMVAVHAGCQLFSYFNWYGSCQPHTQPSTQRKSRTHHRTQHETIAAAYALVSVEEHRNESGRKFDTTCTGTSDGNDIVCCCHATAKLASNTRPHAAWKAVTYQPTLPLPMCFQPATTVQYYGSSSEVAMGCVYTTPV